MTKRRYATVLSIISAAVLLFVVTIFICGCSPDVYGSFAAGGILGESVLGD